MKSKETAIRIRGATRIARPPSNQMKNMRRGTQATPNKAISGCVYLPKSLVAVCASTVERRYLRDCLLEILRQRCDLPLEFYRTLHRVFDVDGQSSDGCLPGFLICTVSHVLFPNFHPIMITYYRLCYPSISFSIYLFYFLTERDVHHGRVNHTSVMFY